MSPLSIGVIITASLLILLCIIIYNKLSVKKNQIQNALSSLDALFIQRADLIPNLIKVVKQYMAFEQDTLTQITRIRTQSTSNKDYLADEESNTLMRQLMVNVEHYPELKANTQFTNLQFSFNECEAQIAAGRRFLSSAITGYNTQVNVFPSNVLAAMFGFKVHQWESATATQRQNVDAGPLFR